MESASIVKMADVSPHSPSSSPIEGNIDYTSITATATVKPVGKLVSLSHVKKTKASLASSNSVITTDTKAVVAPVGKLVSLSHIKVSRKKQVAVEEGNFSEETDNTDDGEKETPDGPTGRAMAPNLKFFGKLVNDMATTNKRIIENNGIFCRKGGGASKLRSKGSRRKRLDAMETIYSLATKFNIEITIHNEESIRNDLLAPDPVKLEAREAEQQLAASRAHLRTTSSTAVLDPPEIDIMVSGRHFEETEGMDADEQREFFMRRKIRLENERERSSSSMNTTTNISDGKKVGGTSKNKPGLISKSKGSSSNSGSSDNAKVGEKRDRVADDSSKRGKKKKKRMPRMKVGGVAGALLRGTLKQKKS